MRVNGTLGDDTFLLRVSIDGLAFVANINENDRVERVDYRGFERLSVNGDLGNDGFYVDDNVGEATLNPHTELNRKHVQVRGSGAPTSTTWCAR